MVIYITLIGVTVLGKCESSCMDPNDCAILSLWKNDRVRVGDVEVSFKALLKFGVPKLAKWLKEVVILHLDIFIIQTWERCCRVEQVQVRSYANMTLEETRVDPMLWFVLRVSRFSGIEVDETECG
jgi:hypothetical protein